MSQKTPQFEREMFNMVLLGNWNPAIFHPEWFVRCGLMGESFSKEASIKVVAPRFTSFEAAGLTVECNPTRLTIEVGDMAQSARLFALIPGILRLLSHTPLLAVGTNHRVAVPVETEQEWLNIGHNLAPKKGTWDTICKDPRTLQLMIKNYVEWRYPVLEHLNVQPDAEGHRVLILNANYHLDLYTIDEKEEPVATVQSFLADFGDAMIRRAKDVAQMIFDTTLSNAS